MRDRMLVGVAASLLAVARLAPEVLRRARERRYQEQARRLDAYIQDCLARNRRLASGDIPAESSPESADVAG